MTTFLSFMSPWNHLESVYVVSFKVSKQLHILLIFTLFLTFVTSFFARPLYVLSYHAEAIQCDYSQR